MNGLKLTNRLLPFVITVIFAVFSVQNAFAKDESSVIIATVDNVKGLIDMNSVKSICDDFQYDKFKFIGIPGELNIYNKSCVCIEYKQFKQKPLQSGEAFMKVIRSCKVNIQFESIESAEQVEVDREQSGYIIPDTEEEENIEQEKIVVEETLTGNHNIYPNPVKSTFYLSYTNVSDLDHISFKLYDAIGKQIRLDLPELKTQSGSFEITIDVSNLQKGLYFYNFNQGDKQYTGRLYKS